jgi:DNA-binding GntR family transcriptional regulator
VAKLPIRAAQRRGAAHPLHEEVAAYLRRAIASGGLRPGQKLSEKEVSARLRVSRTPVREAFRRLHTEGFITSRPRRGATVTRLSARDLREIYPILATLEALATRLAMAHLAAGDFARLRRLNRAMADHADGGDEAAFMRANAEFHALFYRRCGNVRLQALVRQLRDQTYRLRLFAVSVPGRMHEAVKEHDEIVAALQSGEGLAAERAVRLHIEKAMGLLIRQWQLHEHLLAG